MHADKWLNSFNLNSLASTLKAFASFALVAVVGAPAANAQAPPLDGWLSDLDTAVEQAKERDAFILVDLYADWCGWCKTLEKEVFSSKPFRDYAEEFVLLRVDTEDGAEGSALQSRYQAASLPTTLILDADMVKVGSIGGYAPTETFVRYLDEQVEAWAIMLTNYEVVLASDEVELQRQLAEDFHNRGAGARAAALYRKVLSRVQKGTEAEAWLHYLAADAQRLDGDFEAAREHITASNTAASRAGGDATGQVAELRERVDFLRFQIAKDLGDCQDAKTTLKHFLDAHPESFLKPQVRYTLKELEKGRSICT